MEFLTNFNYNLILEIYDLAYIVVFSFGLHFILFLFLLKSLSASNFQVKLSYLINNYFFMTVPVLVCFLVYLYINNPIYLGDENKIGVTFAIADMKMSGKDAGTLLSFLCSGSAFILGGGVAATFFKGTKVALFPRLTMTAASGALMGTGYHTVQSILNQLKPIQNSEVTLHLKVKVMIDNTLAGHGHVRNLVKDTLLTEFNKLALSPSTQNNLSVVVNSISQEETSPPSDFNASDLPQLNEIPQLEVTVLQGQKAIDNVNCESSAALEPAPAAPSTPTSSSSSHSVGGLDGGSWPASSPLETENLLDLSNQESIVNILSLNLTMLSIMLYFLVMLFLIITAKLLLENQIEFNFIKKLPYGNGLHYYFLKYITLVRRVNSVWLYFILCNLFIGNVIVIFSLYKIISVLG